MGDEKKEHKILAETHSLSEDSVWKFYYRHIDVYCVSCDGTKTVEVSNGESLDYICAACGNDCEVKTRPEDWDA